MIERISSNKQFRQTHSFSIKKAERIRKNTYYVNVRVNIWSSRKMKTEKNSESTIYIYKNE